MLLAASSPLTKIIPGLMIWTIVFFVIVFLSLFIGGIALAWAMYPFPLR